MTPQFLSQSQINQFIETGYLIPPRAFSPDMASTFVDRGFERLGYLRNDPKTWKQDSIHTPSTRHFDLADFSPPAWQAEMLEEEQTRQNSLTEKSAK